MTAREEHRSRDARQAHCAIACCVVLGLPQHRAGSGCTTRVQFLVYLVRNPLIAICKRFVGGQVMESVVQEAKHGDARAGKIVKQQESASDVAVVSRERRTGDVSHQLRLRAR